MFATFATGEQALYKIGTAQLEVLEAAYDLRMTLRALVVGFVIATSEPVHRLFATEHPKTVVQLIQDVQCPPCFYIKIDEQVFEVML